MWRWALRHEFPIFTEDRHLNKPLSFRSAPASWVSDLIVIGSQTCIWLSFFGDPDGTMWTLVRPTRAQAGGLPTAYGRLTPWQELQGFPSSLSQWLSLLSHSRNQTPLNSLLVKGHGWKSTHSNLGSWWTPILGVVFLNWNIIVQRSLQGNRTTF